VTRVSNDVILIVDDSKFIAQAYSRVLLGLGYRVLIACDGKTGLFAAESSLVNFPSPCESAVSQYRVGLNCT
jgi:CheY-like chemotaxis protein